MAASSSSSSLSKLKVPPPSSSTSSLSTATNPTRRSTNTNTTTRATPHAWARIRKRSASEASELAQRTSTKTSEYRLRMESVLWWRQHVQQAKLCAWQRLVGPTITECHDFLGCQRNCAHESCENKNSPVNAQEIKNGNDHDEPWWQQFCLPSSTIPSTSSTSSNNLPRIRYPAEVLPVMVISSPLASSCLVDRHAIATTVWNEWNNNSHGSSDDLVLFLPRLLPTLTDTLHLLADGMITILKQSPRCSNYSFLLSSRKKRKRTLQSSIQDWIFEVLQSLPARDPSSDEAHSDNNRQDIHDNRATPSPSLVIVLQDDVASSNVVKQQFLQTLTAWRSLHGIPVSLVVLESSSNGPDGSLSSILKKNEDYYVSGRFGRRVTYLAAPSAGDSSSTFPEAMALWTQYFLEALESAPPPIVVVSNGDEAPRNALMGWIQQTISESASCSRLADCLLNRIVEFFSQPGSFVWDSLRSPASDGSFSSAHIFQPSFCAWFCVYEKAQLMLSQSDAGTSTKITSEEKCRALLECRRILQPGGRVHFWWSVSCALLPLQMWVVAHKQMATTQSQDGNEKPLPSSHNFMLSHLARVYRLVAGRASASVEQLKQDNVAQILSRYLQKNEPEANGVGETIDKTNDFDAETLGKLKKMVGELVLIAHSFQGKLVVGTTMNVKDIMKGISQMILNTNHVAAERLNLWTRRWMYVNPLMKRMDVEDPLLQREKVKPSLSMNALNIRRDVVAGLDSSTQRLLNVLQDQMTIAKTDWFRAFGGSMEEFCVGLWTLQMIGLVQRKKGSGSGANKVVYEKVSVLWC